MYRSTCRTVGLFDGKARLSDRTVRTDGHVQCFSQRFDLADFHSVSFFRTFSNFGDLIATVVQAGLGQGYRIVTIGNVQSITV